MSGYEPQDANVNGALPHFHCIASLEISVAFQRPSRVLYQHTIMRSRLTLVFTGYNSRTPSQAYPSLIECFARRPGQDLAYRYALPGAADPQLQQPSAAYDQQSGHMDCGGSAIYQPRATVEAVPSAYDDSILGKYRQISSCIVRRSTKGDRIYISFESNSDLLSPTHPVANLMFGTCPVPAALNLEARKQDACYKYSISANVPPFSDTGCSSSSIPLRLQVQRQSRLGADLFDLGSWLYEEAEQSVHGSSPHEFSRKRSVTDCPADTPRSTKRAKVPEQQSPQPQGYGSYGFSSASQAYPPCLDITNMQKKLTAYGRSQIQQSLQADADTMGSQSLIGSAFTAPSSISPPVGQFSSWSSSYGAGYQSDRSSLAPTAPSFQVSSIPSPDSANPTFIRTSLIPSPGSTSTGSSSDGRFNPYALNPNRAVLHIHGNLEAMERNWTSQEIQDKRRIVRYWWVQRGITLNAYWGPV